MVLNVWTALLFLIGILVGVMFTRMSRVKSNTISQASEGKAEELPSISPQFSEVEDANEEASEISMGELKLIGVDERTAALIMASLCDHLKVPLDELQFKSIKALD